jgi:hypothetical protein
MIENTADLGLRESLKDLEGEALLSKIDEILKEKLNLGLDDIKKPLIEYLVSHAEALSLELPNIVPFGNYEKILEDNDGMAQFLKTDAANSKYWVIYGISDDDKFPQLVRFVFLCTAIDDGNSLKGTVFVSKTGVVRHAFVQPN